MTDPYPVTKHLDDYVDTDRIHASVSDYPYGHRISLHSHDFFELCVVLTGSFIQNFNGNTVVMEKGSAQLIRPLDVHSFEGSGEKGSQLLNLAFSPRVHETLRKALGIEDELAGIALLKPYQVEGYLERLTNRTEKDDRIRKTLIGFYLDYDFALKDHGRRLGEDVVPLWLKRAMNEMTSPENLQLGLEQFVLTSGKSKEHLARTVKRHFGITAGKWINDHRLEYAKVLLGDADKSILEIAFEVGFNSESYFYRQYREYFGKAPGEDRA